MTFDMRGLDWKAYLTDPHTEWKDILRFFASFTNVEDYCQSQGPSSLSQPAHQTLSALALFPAVAHLHYRC